MMLKVPMSSVLTAPGMPELNHSQIAAIKSVLQAPLSLIQVRAGQAQRAPYCICLPVWFGCQYLLHFPQHPPGGSGCTQHQHYIAS